MTFLTLVGSVAFLAYIWHRIHLLPAPVIAVFVVGTMLFSTAGLASELLEARFRRKIWRWDDRGITFRNRRSSWTVFQCFEVVHGSLNADLDTFRLQFREYFLTAGIWIEVTAHHFDIEALATVAAQHLVDKSKPKA